MDGLGDVNRANLFLCGFGFFVYICQKFYKTASRYGYRYKVDTEVFQLS